MLKHEETTDIIINVYYHVYNTLGHGFLESVYKNAMYYRLKDIGLKVETEKPIEVFYDKWKVGHFKADLVVEDCVIIELKATPEIFAKHKRQLQNYLKATNIEVGLLMNFGEKAEFIRWVQSN